MDDNKSTPISYEIQKCLTHGLGPFFDRDIIAIRVPIAQNDVVVGEVFRGAGLRVFGDVNGETLVLCQNLLELGCRHFPVVIILSRENQNVQRFFLGDTAGRENSEQKHRDDGKTQS